MNKTKIFSLFILLFSLFFLLSTFGTVSFSEWRKSSISVIVIDPGHGGKDWGTSVENAREKEIVLDIALQLGKRIKAQFPEIKVIYTRTSDIFIPLHQRAEIANDNKADLFISIHVNAAEQSWVKGTETYVFGQARNEDNLDVAKKENSVILQENNYNISYKGFDPESHESYIEFELLQDTYLEKSVMFASYIQTHLKEKALRADRNIRQADFLVLRQITMPGVLIETGYLSNPSERSFLTSTDGKKSISEAIFNAFKAFKNKIESKSEKDFIVKKTDLPIEQSLEISEITNEEIKQNSPSKMEVNRITFSVQIMALKKYINATPENFKDEANIFVIESFDFNRYFTGRFKTLDEAKDERKRIQHLFSNAFIVAFENNQLISVKKALGKM